MRRGTAAALLAAAAAIPTAAAAQSCGLTGGTGIAAVAGFAAYDVAATSGPAFGVDGDLGLAGGSARASLRRMNLDRRTAHLGRLAAAVPLPLPFEPGPITVCAVGHAGVARLPVDDEATTALAGGAGLRLAATLPFAAGSAVPYGEVRGLAARTAGTLLGVAVDATGLALGGEGGVQVTFDRITLRVAASVDGFHEGLGVTPYPNAAAELAVGIRF